MDADGLRRARNARSTLSNRAFARDVMASISESAAATVGDTAATPAGSLAVDALEPLLSHAFGMSYGVFGVLYSTSF